MRCRTRLAAALASLAAAVLIQLAGCSGADGERPAGRAEWLTYGGGLDRTFFNGDETAIRRDTASRLVPLWRFLTGAIVVASPIVARIEIPGEGGVPTVFIPSWDGHLYALRATDGSLVWSFAFKPHPGASFPQASSATVADLDGRRLLWIGSGMTLYCLDATTGEEVWEFDAGTGCTDCDYLEERNEILSSPAVHDGAVYFGMDVNDFGTGKGGFFAVDARRGTLRWYFDLETGATCTPAAGDEVRRFDGYHTAAELGLPRDFFATRPGCDFDRAGNACGNVWSSAAIDPTRRLLYTVSGNCDTDDDPATPAPPPPMPPFDEAIFALDLATGRPAWRWRPREVDEDDFDFGAVPNLFSVEIEGARREVVGVGGKDGTYYVLDRDGVNEISGRVEPYWKRRVVPGGDEGGIISSAAVGDGLVLFSTGVGDDLANPQKPAAWGLDARTGAVRWSNAEAPPSFSPALAVPGVTFLGSIAGTLFGYDATTGERLVALAAGGPLFSPAVAVGGRLFVGSGAGQRGTPPDRISFQSSLAPSPVSAFCVAGSEGCPELGTCDDGNGCTADRRAADGACRNERRPDGTPCTVGVFSGECRSGVCLSDEVL